jgi:thioredoxin 1
VFGRGDLSNSNANNWTEEVFKSTVLTVVYFWHNPCPWCSSLNPIFAKIAEEFRGKIRFLKLNILENPANQD